MVIRPAAGPLTPNLDPLKSVTTKPPIIPAIIPAKGSASEPWAIPKQSGNATNQTTRPAGKSFFKYDILILFLNMLKYFLWLNQRTLIKRTERSHIMWKILKFN